MDLLIIGCGNIGQRHLQSVLKINNAKIFVVEKNNKTLVKLKNKFSEKNIQFFKTLLELREIKCKFNFIVISTNSDSRLQILKKITKNIKFNFMILEKVAFPSESQFLSVIKNFKKFNKKIYVNTPLRSVKFFEKIKSKDINSFEMNVSGSNWNLFSNSIHYLDLFFYLTNKNPKLLDVNLNRRIFKSKRSGFYEGFGQINFKTDCGKKLTLNCIRNKKIRFNLLIEFKINNKIIKLYSKNGYEYYNYFNNKLIFKIPFQSNLTHKQIEFIENKKFILPDLNENYLHQKEIFKSLHIYKKRIRKIKAKNIFIS